MRALGIILILLWELLTTASSHSRAHSAAEPPPPAITKEWLSNLQKAFPLVDQPEKCRAALGRAIELSARYPRFRLAAKTSEYLAYGLAHEFRFAEATRAYVETKRLAQAAGDRETESSAANALSNIYLSSGNTAAALEASRQAVHSLPAKSPSAAHATFEGQYARLLARSGRMREAEDVFANVAARCERQGLWSQLADARKFAGREYMMRGEWEPAEFAVRESIRLRLTHRLPELASDFHDLAAIRLGAGSASEALALLTLARGRVSTTYRFAVWRLDLLEGRALLALHQSQRALELLRRAIIDITTSPLFLLPGDALRSQVVTPAEAYEVFSEAALQEFGRSGDRRLLDQAFAASEAGRAAALRASNSGRPLPAGLAARYWRLVGGLTDANAKLLAKDSEAERARINRIRLELAELEADVDAGVSPGSHFDAPPPLQAVHKGEAFISFHLGEHTSLAWTLAEGQLHATRLPARAALSALLKNWLSAAPGPERMQGAHELYRILLAPLPRPVHEAPGWLIAADGVLFGVPWSALVAKPDLRRPLYVAHQHSTQLIPGAWALERRLPTQLAGSFLGVGDPIYNDGDQRRGSSWLAALRSSATASAAVLPRLPGSAAEVKACARLFASAQTLLGRDAVPELFSIRLASGPAVVHLATHMVPAPDSPNENLMALGARDQSQPAYVGPEWIGAHRLPGSLVVMNGCRSGSGTVSTNEGLMGLTRAWLRAGASRVVSTYWPTLDDGGAFAAAFYRHLMEDRVPAAEALRRTQIALIEHSGWQNDPQYWAAYFLTGYPE